MQIDVNKYDFFLVKALFLLVFVFMSGCAVTPTYTAYGLDSNPSGADIYRGTSADNLTYYKTAPFRLNSSGSLGWSNNLFQARKKGFKDSAIYRQPYSALGNPINIYFNLESEGGAEELVRYKNMNSIAGYYEFLQTYPESLVKKEVYEAIVVLIPDSTVPADEYSRLSNDYPDAISLMPDDVRLSYVGPPGMKVTDIQKLLMQGIGEAVLEQKIIGAEKPYAEFSFDEIRQLTEMGLSDKVIAAMLKATKIHQDKNQSAVPAPVTRGNQLVRPQSAQSLQGYVQPAAGTSPTNSVGEVAIDCAAFLAKKKACDQLGMFGSMICMKAIPAGHNCF